MERHPMSVSNNMNSARKSEALVAVMPCIKESKVFGLNHAKFQSFHEFMTFWAPLSFQVLYRLDVSALTLKDLSSHERSLLADILRQAGPYIKKIWLPSFEGLDLSSNRALVQAFWSLTSLDTFEAYGSNSEALRVVLSRLHSPLTEVEIQVEEGADPLPLLANFASTLKVVAFTRGTPSNTDICFPNVVDLDITEGSAPYLEVLMTVFPNVELLQVDDSGWEDDYGEEKCRAQNLKFLKSQRYKRHRPWALLRRLYTDPVPLYALALQQEVEDLLIRGGGDGICYGPDTQLLHASLPSLRPKYLNVGMDADDEVLATGLNDVCGRLERLNLTVPFLKTDGFDEALSALVEGLARSQATLQVLDLNLVVIGNSHPLPAIRYLQALDIEAFADQVQLLLPLLVDLTIKVEFFRHTGFNLKPVAISSLQRRVGNN
ncbi:hypothetical protein EIP86_003660 [Pleurotus ostreatoroseus]|nr:hypothetical protein EIP86_003660 [Pleurotus ostreatoroseus]